MEQALYLFTDFSFPLEGSRFLHYFKLRCLVIDLTVNHFTKNHFAKYRFAKYHFVSFCFHSRPQSLRSFWPVVGIESSGRTRFSEHVQSIRFTLSTNQICWIWREVRETRTSGVGPNQSSPSQSQARRIVGSGDENARIRTPFYIFFLNPDYVAARSLRSLRSNEQ